MSVSERITRRREELGLTQTDLAKRAGLKPPAISQYESGIRNPSYEALIKLSNALDVTTDFLISGSEIKTDISNEKTAKILINLIQSLSVKDRKKLLQYASSLINPLIINTDIPMFNSSIDYADYIYKNYCDNQLPVDPFNIASKLNIIVYRENLQESYEGFFVKNLDRGLIILDSCIDFEPRIKFTLSMLIGHAVIPWHIKSNYYIRKKGTSTLDTEEPSGIEVQEFAAYLLMPQIHFIKDVDKDLISIKDVKDLADNKYKVSVTTFLNHMVDYSNERFALVQSKGCEIKKTHPGKKLLVENVNENSVAYSFYKEPIPQIEEIRESLAPASYWFNDSKENEIVFESSIYNPKFGSVLTLISNVK